MKREYIVPEIKVTCVEIETALLAASELSDQECAKGHGAYFDDWDDEEEDFTLPKSKSLWEDD